LKNDDEIIESIFQFSPEIIAIDAPLSFGDRICDKSLKKYGVMPLKLFSIQNLAKRAVSIVRKLNEVMNIKVLEVFPTGTAKILGTYHKDYKDKQKKLAEKFEIGFSGNFTRDELDSFLCALTGLIFIYGLTIDVGDESGKITIPKESEIEIIIKEIKKLKLVVEK
jgi:predicted nuclease with RNAse H fold